MDYYLRLKEIRKERDMTQEQVAGVLMIGQRTYSDYENGRIRMPIDSLLKLARYYDLSVDYVSGASDIPEKYPQK